CIQPACRKNERCKDPGLAPSSSREPETSVMIRSLPPRRALISLALALGLSGCGGAGVDTGMPSDPNKVDRPLDPSMVDVTGKMGPGAARKAQVDAAKAAKQSAASPGGGAPAENK